MADNGPTHTFARARVMVVDPNKMTPSYTILTDVTVDQLGVTGTVVTPAQDAGRIVFHPTHRVLVVIEAHPDDPT